MHVYIRYLGLKAVYLLEFTYPHLSVISTHTLLLPNGQHNVIGPKVSRIRDRAIANVKRWVTYLLLRIAYLLNF